MAKIKFEKTLRIASELLSYCHHYGATEFHLDIVEEPDSVKLVLSACPDEIPEKDMEKLVTSLSAPRQRDIEQDYWELMGDSEEFFELTLLGMLCDEASVEYEDLVLTITLKRYD